MRSTGALTFTVMATPLTPAADGVSVVLPPARPRTTTSAANCPAGMNAGSGDEFHVTRADANRLLG